jgi:hypothetical protein
MKKTMAVTLCSIVILSCSASWADNFTLNWKQLKIAFENYVEYPSSENALRVSALLPENHVKLMDDKDAKEAREYIWSQLNMLERQVISKDRAAVRLAFRLFCISDGAFTEELDMMLGSLIRIDPVLFLEELKRSKHPVLSNGGLVANLGVMYVDRYKARCYGIQQRIKSLEAVNVPLLRAERDKCINILKDDYRLYCK